MKTLVLALSFFLPLASLAADRAKPGAKPAPANRLICKTGSEKRAPGQPLKLYFNYHMPIVFEPEDPTLPLGRQSLVLAGRPVVQLFFERASGPAGEAGELLHPMQCAFTKRAVRASEPAVVQILLQPGQIHWLSQPLGQRAGAEKVTMQPSGDWTFIYESEKVFSVELDDLKTFLTVQMPREL